MITAEQAQKRVTEVRKAARRGDHQAALILEYDLMRRALETVADPGRTTKAALADLAAVTLESSKVKFTRPAQLTRPGQ